MFRFLSLLVASIILLAVQSCSTNKKIAFGNRKFYPDPVRKSQTISYPKVVQSEVSDNKEASLQATCQTVEEVPVSEQSLKSYSKLTLRKRWQNIKNALALKAILNRSEISASTKSHVSQSLVQDDRKVPGSAIVGFILGLLSLFILPVVFGILGIIFSAVALSKDGDEYKKGLAVAGLILSIIGIVSAVYIASQM